MAYNDLTLTQKNYCTLNNKNEGDCVSFFDNVGNRDPIYNDLSMEQKTQCSLLEVDNVECLTYWVGKNDGTPPGTLPHTPIYNDLNQGQKDYCELNNLDNDYCVELFFGGFKYSTLTDAQKDYCQLNSLSNSECVLHFITEKKSDTELNENMSNSLENQNNSILYFDDLAFNNSTLKTKNELLPNSSRAVSYVVLNTEKDLNNINDVISNKIGKDNVKGALYNSFKHYAKENTDFSNILMEDSYQSTKWITLNSPDNQDSEIKEVVFNLEAANGIYAVSDKGHFQHHGVNVRVEIVGWDKSYTNYRTYSGSVTLGSSIVYSGSSNAFGGIISLIKGMGSSGKTPIRLTGSIPVSPGFYQVRIIRNAPSSHHNSKVSDNFNIKSVYGVYDINKMYKDISLLAVRFDSKKQFTQSSALSINALVRKRSTIKDSYFPYQLTLRDFIIDIWTNKKTGLGMSINDLDIRVDLQENCNLVLDQQDNAFNVISDVLKSFGYVFYPHNNSYIIDKDGIKLERSYVFHEGNYRDISFNYNIPQDLEDGDGVRVKYLKQGMKDLTEFTYPSNANNPNEVVLRGVSHPAIAEATAKRMHKKSKMRSKTCTITTDLEGLIPELNSRVAVSSKYLKNTITSSISKVEIITEENEVKTKVFLPDFVIFQSKYKKCMILTKDLKGSEKYSIQFSDERRDYVIINQYLDIAPDHIIVIGEEDEFLEDYIVEIITPEQDNEGNITSVKLNLIEYNPEVYT